jgi:hypothetical protein
MKTPSKSWLVSRVPLFGKETPVAVCESREDANKLIAKLEDADPKGSLVWYNRVEVVDSDPTFCVADAAAEMASWSD